eukprot:TRINITY_DN18652_c0_g1_i1.p1 TRINITY_DN18652_c0_g1~~TRINITY_DN18652_c0_g1_i1.p1  ORF type:complete len:434 (-),score=119.58 TRINITY_DN18652_c0_g1_i1:18-1319(-)
MNALASFAVLATVAHFAAAETSYLLGPQGWSCFDACHAKGLNCNPRIVTNNSSQIFTSLGIQCDADPQAWWAEDQPSYVSNKSDPNYGKCLGYMGTPTGVWCGGFYPTTQRVCACDSPDDASPVAAFSTGYSGGYVNTEERTMFNHIVPSAATNGVMTHYWTTAPGFVLNGTLVRYYIDDEPVASIQFFPPLACGVGFNDEHAPWGTRWFGKGAADGAWFNNFRIPFQKSIKVTVQHMTGSYGGFYMIVRGAPSLPIDVGGIAVPSTARLQLQTFEQTVPPLTWVPIVDVPTGSGVFWMHTLSVRSGNLNFLEGCYHQYAPYNKDFPGSLLSTGTEDYFDSAWYFNGGQFWLENAGFTHINTSAAGNMVTWSAYRFHEQDPLPFDSGFRLMWRNGDVVDRAGLKCNVEDTNGIIAGNPTASDVIVYAWVYTWD